MKEGIDLTKEFLIEGVEIDELEDLFQSHFGHGQMSSEDAVSHFHDNPSSYGLTVKYSARKKYRSIKSIISGPGLSDQSYEILMKRLQTDIIQSEGNFVGNTILFNIYPVVGYFQYEDILAIKPLPDGAPKPSYSLPGSHPFLMEYSFRKSCDFGLNAIRRYKIIKEYSSLLNVLLEGEVVYQSNKLHFTWVHIPASDSSGRDPFFSKHCQLGYSPKPVVLPDETENFRNIDLLNHLETIDPHNYYNRDSVRDGRPLQIPSDLFDSLKKYFSLKVSLRKDFQRACFWMLSADKVSLHSDSVAFLSFVNAIESVISEPQSSGRCDKCKREFKKSLTKLFKEFLDEFASEVEKPIRDNLYAIRSKLAHGGGILVSDLGIGHGFNPSYFQDKEYFTLIKRVGKIALHNWLLSQ